jgi:N6-L-threonylcarbamoyladenine synthase
MRILAIDTSCDETAAAVTEGVTVLSNVVWSQASQHAQFGGVMPSLAQRMHKERIDWVIRKAILSAQCSFTDIKAVAVTAGPGLAIALGVGIAKAKEIAEKHHLPLIPVNHIEGHLLSPMAKSSTSHLLSPSPKLGEGPGVRYPALGLVVSGGHTELIKIDGIEKYQILAKTHDDALGEALDKAARMLGLGYPGGAILEKMARHGNPKSYPLPLPMARSGNRNSFSYSGLKTAFYRLVNSLNTSTSLSKTQVYDLAASFQNRAFQHLIRVCADQCSIFNIQYSIKDLLVGGGVAANMELRKRLRKMGKESGLTIRLPYSLKLNGDNAAMIGVAAYFKLLNPKFEAPSIEMIDRRPKWPIDQDFLKSCFAGSE